MLKKGFKLLFGSGVQRVQDFFTKCRARFLAQTAISKDLCDSCRRRSLHQKKSRCTSPDPFTPGRVVGPLGLKLFGVHGVGVSLILVFRPTPD